MAAVTIDVQAIPGAVAKARQALRPGQNRFSGEWTSAQPKLDFIERFAVKVMATPALGQFVVLERDEFLLLAPYLEPPATEF